jgi:ABC-type branched-subunit amino acid transport system substrate-binding protein
MSDTPDLQGSSLERRKFLRVAGAGLTGLGILPVLAACGSSSSSSAGSTAGSTAGAAATASGTSGTVPGIAAIKQFLGFDTLSAATLGTGKTITMTAQLPLTGTYAYYGVVFGNGLKLAAKHIKAMDGPTINLTFQDNKSPDPQTIISGTRQIISEGQQFMITSVSGNFGAILPTLASTNNIVCLNTTEGYGVPPELGAKNYWETDGNISLCLPFVGQYLQGALPGKSKMALVSSDQGAKANAALNTSVSSALIGGWKLVNAQYVPAGTNDYTSVVSRVGEANPDVVACALGSGAFGQFVKAYRQAGLQGTIIVYGSPPSIDDYQAVGSVLAGVVYLGPLFNLSDPGNPWGDFFLAEYNAAYGKKPGEPDIYATNFYVNLFTWWQLWQKAWATGVEPTAVLVNQYLEASPTLKTILGGNQTTVGTTVVHGNTHFADMLQGAYEIQADFSFKQIATSGPAGLGYTKL